jgi:DNA replication protein DnaC
VAKVGPRRTGAAGPAARREEGESSPYLADEQRRGLLIDAEYFARGNKRLTRLLREARLKVSQACIENIDYGVKRELDKAVIRQLATCRWIQEHQNCWSPA